MNKNKKFDPFENLALDKYEQELEDALNKGNMFLTQTSKKLKNV